jgi:uncharacterized protein YjiS (DUF1127 family)
MACASGSQGCNSEYNLSQSSSGRLLVRPREAFAHRRQRRALAALDWRLLDDIGVSGEAAARETSKPIWK